VRLKSAVSVAIYDEGSASWTVEVAGGERLRCNVLMTAAGQLSRPKMPDVDGLDRFAGASLRSAQWDHDIDPADKRVAVVGSGASAIQIVPSFVNTVKALTVIQRSPSGSSARASAGTAGAPSTPPALRKIDSLYT
jgi:cation diffusion facilitator CzcD-associated flavoprotein CzcO